MPNKSEGYQLSTREYLAKIVIGSVGLTAGVSFLIGALYYKDFALAGVGLGAIVASSNLLAIPS